VKEQALRLAANVAKLPDSLQQAILIARNPTLEGFNQFCFCNLRASVYRRVTGRL
jgi:hypothetical protein